MNTLVSEGTGTTNIRDSPSIARNRTDVLQNSMGKHFRNRGFPVGTQRNSDRFISLNMNMSQLASLRDLHQPGRPVSSVWQFYPAPLLKNWPL